MIIILMFMIIRVEAVSHGQYISNGAGGHLNGEADMDGLASV